MECAYARVCVVRFAGMLVAACHAIMQVCVACVHIWLFEWWYILYILIYVYIYNLKCVMSVHAFCACTLLQRRTFHRVKLRAAHDDDDDVVNPPVDATVVVVGSQSVIQAF